LASQEEYNFRATIWSKIQNKLSGLLMASDLGKCNIEKYIQLFHIVFLMCELGEEFSESDAHQLRGYLRARSQTYLMAFHRDNLENFKSMIESESWQRLDATGFVLDEIPEFGLRSQFRTSTIDRVESNIKNVRMFLHSPDPSQNPFKLVSHIGKFQLEESEPEQLVTPAPVYDDSSDTVSLTESDSELSDMKTPSTPTSKGNNQLVQDDPTITNISLTMIKRMASYIYALETMQLINVDIFEALTSLFQFYVSIWYSHELLLTGILDILCLHAILL
jgi:hypothetical protein